MIAIIGSLVVVIYKHEKNKPLADLNRRIREISPRGSTPQTIDGLKEAIALYEAQIELNVKVGAQTGVYWKILAIRLADKGMHQDALAALERAIYYNAEEALLFYRTGESASVVAASSVGFSTDPGKGREYYYKLSENAYLRAIQLDPLYARPMLGLGILYTFDLNRPAEAVPYLERYQGLMQNDINGMFVLARAYFMTEQFDRAIELYDQIITRTKSPKVKDEAQNNKEFIRNLIYG